MKSILLSAALCAVLPFATGAALAQGTEDSVASGGKFPLAAPAGVDSGALAKAPAGAANQGPYDMTKWKYGHAFDAPNGTPIWNPVKVKMQAGGKITSITVPSPKMAPVLTRKLPQRTPGTASMPTATGSDTFSAV